MRGDRKEERIDEREVGVCVAAAAGTKAGRNIVEAGWWGVGGSVSQGGLVGGAGVGCGVEMAAGEHGERRLRWA